MESDSPPFLYRVLTERKFAEDFLTRGYFRLGLIDYYKKIEDPNRRDKNERESNYLFPCETGHCHAGGTFIGPIYLLCTHGPKADSCHVKSKGEFLIKINDPERFLVDLDAAIPLDSTIELIGKPSLEKIRYTKGEVDSIDPESKEALRLDYSQKTPSDNRDDEYRYIFFARQPLKGEPPEFIYFYLGRSLKYLELLKL
jgi:hypothetical protein